MWHRKYMDLAEKISEWSKDPSTKVGAVIVSKEGQILAQGYNGFPRKIKDLKTRLNNRNVKLDYIVHAEMNAIYNSSLSGVSLKNSTLYVYGLPVCHECSKGIIQVGVSTVVIEKNKENVKWKKSCDLAKEILKEASIKIIEI